MELIIGLLSFPDDLTSIQILSLILVSFATCFFSGIIGIGGGLILLAFYATVLPITAVIPVHGFLQFWNNLWRAILTRDFHAPVLRSFIMGFFVGTGISMLFAVSLSAPILQISIGIFVLYSVLGNIPALSQRYLFFGSTISMVLSFIIGGTAPLIAAMLNSFSLEAKPFISTLALVLAVQHGLKIITLGYLGFDFAQYIFVMFLAICAGMIGTYFGVMIMFRIKNNILTQLVKAALILLSVRLIYLGGTTFLLGQ